LDCPPIPALYYTYIGMKSSGGIDVPLDDAELTVVLDLAGNSL
jgi:imidazoleglycerol phosphate dehydratase HisB